MCGDVNVCHVCHITVTPKNKVKRYIWKRAGGLGGEEGDVQRALWYASMSGDEEACALLLRQVSYEMTQSIKKQPSILIDNTYEGQVYNIIQY